MRQSVAVYRQRRPCHLYRQRPSDFTRPSVCRLLPHGVLGLSGEVDLRTGLIRAVNEGSIYLFWPQIRWTSDSKTLLTEGYEHLNCPIAIATPAGPGGPEPPAAPTPTANTSPDHCYDAVFAISRDGKHIRRLTRTPTGTPVSARRGARVAIASLGGGGISILTPASGHVTRALTLPSSLSAISSFDWAADGRFVFSAWQVGQPGGAPASPAGLWITDRNGQNPRKIRNGWWDSPRFVDNKTIVAVTGPDNSNLCCAAWIQTHRVVRLTISGGGTVQTEQQILPQGTASIDIAPPQ